MPTDKIDHDEANHIVENSIEWYNDNVENIGELSRERIKEFCDLYCEYVKHRFGVVVAIHETDNMFKRNVVVDLDRTDPDALVMLKLATN